jgi:hypothetical protein
LGLCLAVRKLSSSPKNVLYFIRTSTLLLQCCPKKIKKIVPATPLIIFSHFISMDYSSSTQFLPKGYSSDEQIDCFRRPAGLRFSLDPLLRQGGHAVASFREVNQVAIDLRGAARRSRHQGAEPGCISAASSSAGLAFSYLA